ncbi:MFS general substrate transporter, partial [Exidia glandulosa HHB12029]
MSAQRSPTASLSDKDKLGAEESRLDTVASPTPDGPGPSSRVKAGDAALEILGDGSTRHQYTEEEDRRVLRKIDFWVMPIVLMVYFLQQLDKSSVSYASVFGLVQQTGLVGKQYSWLTSIVYVAQLVWQPMSSYMLVRFPLSKYLFVHVLFWGVIVASTAGAHNFKGLITARFFLGIFEAT